MRVLVGAACIAIVLASGYYVWIEYQRDVLARADEAHFRCRGAVAALDRRDFTKRSEIVTKALARNCVKGGMLAAEEVAGFGL